MAAELDAEAEASRMQCEQFEAGEAVEAKGVHDDVSGMTS